MTNLDYQSWNLSESTHNNEWFNVEKFCSAIINGTVISVKISPWHDLRIKLDNDVVIECLIVNSHLHYDEESLKSEGCGGVK